MAAHILTGKLLAARIKEEISSEVSRIRSYYKIQPGLAVLMVGNNASSQAYVRGKLQACREAGFFSFKEVFPEETKESILLERIQKLNNQDDIHGVLVQLPLPEHIDADRVMAVLNPDKDVDGFHPINRGKLVVGQSDLIPCTPKGIVELLQSYDISFAGKHVVIVGRSNVVGKPLASLLLNCGATVTVCHSQTVNLKNITLQADILVLAMGKPHAITADFVTANTIVVDVGFTRFNGKGCGDAAPDVASKVQGITPVPGGIGPMTIAMLLKNTLIATKKLHHIK